MMPGYRLSFKLTSTSGAGVEREEERGKLSKRSKEECSREKKGLLGGCVPPEIAKNAKEPERDARRRSAILRVDN